MNTLKPLILVTNDDGVSARTQALIAVMAEIGDVLVVAQTGPKAAWVMHNNKQHLIFKQNL
jgi:broad specificity polyphosphatase/5'/3'-nucleotidase SurE